jgi:CubicO group peptidase (beta-lactamase class C family)
VIDTSTAASRFAGYGVVVTTAEPMRGAALLQRGTEDLVAIAAGPAGTDPGSECSLSTRFQIASVTKQFTAAAVLLLADRGVLSAADPVHRWLDDCPAAWEPITLHHLLSHTAGLVHWQQLPELDVTRAVPVGEKLRIFAGTPLLSPPGERYSYSSPGYVLLAHIIERAAGQPYPEFVDQEIFQPLGMTATFDGGPRGQHDLAAGRDDGAAVASFDLDTLGMGTGSIWSTVGDLARWDRALAEGQILSAAARQAMLTAHAPLEDDDSLIRTEGYGYGWYIATAANGRRFYYHTGDNPGFRSFNAWFPDDDVRLALLSNEAGTDLGPIAHDLIRQAFPGTAAP